MRVFWWLMLWAGVLGAALSLAGRVRHELRPSPVEIALEWSDATRLSGAGRVPIDRWLASMRAAGARGVVLPVQSVRDLAEEGRLTLWTRAAASPFFRSVRTLDSGYNFVVVCRDEKLRVRVRAALADASRVLPLVELDATGFAVALSPATMGTWPVGLDPLALQQLREAKLEPLARLGDFSGATPARSSAQFLALRRDGVRLLVAGDPSPGNETLLPKTARSMRANGLSLAWVELDTARGTPELAHRRQISLLRRRSRRQTA